MRSTAGTSARRPPTPAATKALMSSMSSNLTAPSFAGRGVEIAWHRQVHKQERLPTAGCHRRFDVGDAEQLLRPVRATGYHVGFRQCRARPCPGTARARRASATSSARFPVRFASVHHRHAGCPKARATDFPDFAQPDYKGLLAVQTAEYRRGHLNCGVTEFDVVPHEMVVSAGGHACPPSLRDGRLPQGRSTAPSLLATSQA